MRKRKLFQKGAHSPGQIRKYFSALARYSALDTPQMRVTMYITPPPKKKSLGTRYCMQFLLTIFVWKVRRHESAKKSVSRSLRVALMLTAKKLGYRRKPQ